MYHSESGSQTRRPEDAPCLWKWEQRDPLSKIVHDAQNRALILNRGQRGLLLYTHRAVATGESECNWHASCTYYIPPAIDQFPIETVANPARWQYYLLI